MSTTLQSTDSARVVLRHEAGSCTGTLSPVAGMSPLISFLIQYEVFGERRFFYVSAQSAEEAQQKFGFIFRGRSFLIEDVMWPRFNPVLARPGVRVLRSLLHKNPPREDRFEPVELDFHRYSNGQSAPIDLKERKATAGIFIDQNDRPRPLNISDLRERSRCVVPDAEEFKQPTGSSTQVRCKVCGVISGATYQVKELRSKGLGSKLTVKVDKETLFCDRAQCIEVRSYSSDYEARKDAVDVDGLTELDREYCKSTLNWAMSHGPEKRVNIFLSAADFQWIKRKPQDEDPNREVHFQAHRTRGRGKSRQQCPVQFDPYISRSRGKVSQDQDDGQEELIKVGNFYIPVPVEPLEDTCSPAISFEDEVRERMKEFHPDNQIKTFATPMTRTQRAVSWLRDEARRQEDFERVDNLNAALNTLHGQPQKGRVAPFREFKFPLPPPSSGVLRFWMFSVDSPGKLYRASKNDTKKWDKIVRDAFFEEWKIECKRCERVGLPRPSRPEYFSEPRERYADRSYAPATASNATPDTKKHGSNQGSGFPFRIEFVHPETTMGKHNLNRKESINAIAEWIFLNDWDSFGNLDLDDFRWCAWLYDIHFNSRGKEETAEYFRVTEDYVSDKLEDFRNDVVGRRRKKEWSKLLVHSTDNDLWKTLLNEGGVYALVPIAGQHKGRRGYFEPVKLNIDPSEYTALGGLMAGLVGDSDPPLDYIRKRERAEIEALRSIWLKKAEEEINGQARMKRSNSARKRALDSATREINWRLTRARIVSFGTASEFQKRMFDIVREVREDEALDLDERSEHLDNETAA